MHARTGSPWRDLPPEFGSWNSVYQRFARWSRAGVWHRVFAQLARERRFQEVFIDSTIVRAHQHAAGAQKKRHPGDRAIPRRADDQDSRCGRCHWAAHPRLRLMPAKAVIPPRANRRESIRWSKAIYKHRNLVERFFCRIKHFRRIATR